MNIALANSRMVLKVDGDTMTPQSCADMHAQVVGYMDTESAANRFAAVPEDEMQQLVIRGPQPPRARPTITPIVAVPTLSDRDKGLAYAMALKFGHGQVFPVCPAVVWDFSWGSDY